MAGCILLIDADVDPQLRSGLEHDGHRLIEVRTPADATDALAQPDIDVCLVDVSFDDAQQILDRLEQRSPGVPLMALVRSGELNATLDAVDMGARDIIFKPVQHAVSVLRQIYWAVEREQLRRSNQHLREELERLRPLAAPRAAADAPLSEIGRMVTQVVHEIRNPLTALSAKLQLLRKKAEGVEQVQSLSASLLDEITRLSRFLSEVLEYGRGQKPSDQPVDLGQTLEQVVSLYREECEDNHLVLALNLPSACPAIACGAEQLHQVFQNLLVNAIDATPPDGTIAVDVRTLANEVAVEFKNPGHLSDDTLAKAFDLFFTTKTHGTGMGLALVRRIMNDIGGGVMAQNQDDHVVFRLTFPR